ncbi:MAG: hypothetical protein D9C04_03055 [Nitrosopumilus sp. B06]|nr:MAG: hypothetical protein D9C04_03055 [Nitrosopumilus sp. B06]
MTHRLALPATTFLRTLAILPARDLGVGRMAPVAVVLLMAMVMTVSTGDAAAERPATYDPLTVEYIEEIITEPGTTKKTRTSGNDTWVVTTDVKFASPSIYHVNTIAAFNDESQQVAYEIRINEDGTYRIIIEDLGSDVTYTDSAEVLGGGIGNYDGSRAIISLHNREYGPVGTRLSDSYTGCFGATNARFSAEVLHNLVVASWKTNPYYWYACIHPHGFDYVDVSEGGVSKRFTSQNGHYSFSDHYLGPAWYSISMSFRY